MVMHDFSLFDSRAYLNENFLDDPPDSEDMGLLEFFMRHTDKRDTQLEICGGPTIYQLLPSLDHVGSIIFAEFNEQNRREVIEYLSFSKNSFNWDAHLKSYLKLKGIHSSHDKILEIRKKLSELVKMVIPMDLRKTNPLLEYPTKQFDLVSCHYGIESITDSKNDFMDYILKMISFVKNDGRLNLSMLENATHYLAGDQKFPAFPINLEDMKKILHEFGFCKIKSSKAMPSNKRPYESVFYITAVKLA